MREIHVAGVMIWFARLWSMFLMWLRARLDLPVRGEQLVDGQDLTPKERLMLEQRAIQRKILERATGLPVSAVPPWDPTEPLEVGIDWANGVDIATYHCSACGYDTGIVEDLVAHMKAHGAIRLTVTPRSTPPRFLTMDRVRRG
jgi:hypothetical protein